MNVHIYEPNHTLKIPIFMDMEVDCIFASTDPPCNLGTIFFSKFKETSGFLKQTIKPIVSCYVFFFLWNLLLTYFWNFVSILYTCVRKERSPFLPLWSSKRNKSTLTPSNDPNLIHDPRPQNQICRPQTSAIWLSWRFWRAFLLTWLCFPSLWVWRGA